MKPLITITLLFIISYSFAQWEWQNPLPQSNHLYEIFFTDEYHGWAVGRAGTVLSTSDGGESWSF